MCGLRSDLALLLLVRVFTLHWPASGLLVMWRAYAQTYTGSRLRPALVIAITGRYHTGAQKVRVSLQLPRALPPSHPRELLQGLDCGGATILYHPTTGNCEHK
jgi:hypothetical protein